MIGNIAGIVGLALAFAPPTLPPVRGPGLAPAPSAPAAPSEPIEPDSGSPRPPVQKPVAEAPPPAEPDVPVDLPEEFKGPRRPLVHRAEAPSTEDGPGASEIDVSDEAPVVGEPGDPVAHPSAEYEGVDGPSDPEFEDLTSVRTAVERTPPPRLTFKGEREPPQRTALFGVGYRQFQLADGLGRDQAWHFVGLEVTPLRRYARLNLLTEFGFEGGEAARNGDRADLMLMQKVGVGAQYPHWVSPFVEFQGGIGGARIELFERNDLALVYSLGVDGGVQIAVARHFFLMASIGWIRPYFKIKSNTTYSDRLTFKVGFGF